MTPQIRRRTPIKRGDPLTARELEVLTLAAAGLTNTEIGRRIFLSENTIKRHMVRACVKLGARSAGPAATRAHAVYLAHDLITAQEQHR